MAVRAVFPGVERLLAPFVGAAKTVGLLRLSVHPSYTFCAVPHEAAK